MYRERVNGQWIKAFQGDMANKIVANQMSDNSLENWNWFKLQINGYVKNYNTVCMKGLGANGQWSTWLFKYSHKIKIKTQRKAHAKHDLYHKIFPSVKLTENISTSEFTVSFCHACTILINKFLFLIYTCMYFLQEFID